MKVKTYRTRSFEEALESIKKEMGQEALILNTRSLPRRRVFGLLRPRNWEVTAAVNETADGRTGGQADGRTGGQADGRTGGQADGRTGGQADGRTGGQAPDPPSAPKDHRIDEILDEMAELRRSVRLLGRAFSATAQGNATGVYGELAGNGVDPELADHLVTSASRGNPTPTEIRERVRRLMADMILTDDPVELRSRNRLVCAFVGPTGVGKTTTIAKLASHAALKSKKKVALISTDSLRLSAQEELARYGDLLGIPTYNCTDITALKELVGSLGDRDLILIDTPGCSPSDLARLSRLSEVMSAINARVHLVLSATTKTEDVSKIIKRFQRFCSRRVIFTKVDETESKGSLVGELLRHELQLTYTTDGQRVPDDLRAANALDIARFALPVVT